MFGLKPDAALESPQNYYVLNDYEKGVARWCDGCGDHAVLASIQKLCRDAQLDPAKTVFVSGIGCSSRFPHYMNTYGFHGLHGRAFPVACGIKHRRPDLDVFVITGDGDCCSIGAGAWIHAIRYNVNLTVMLFNNEIYGLTKKQRSPTSPVGTISNTTPRGSILPPLNPMQVSLGVANASFVAQTVDWNPAHMHATIKAAHEHKGFSFVHIFQRCPKFMPQRVEAFTANRDNLCYLKDENGVLVSEEVEKVFKHTLDHDSSDINKARELAQREDRIYLGVFFKDSSKETYDEYGAHNLGFSVEEKTAVLNAEFDKYGI